MRRIKIIINKIKYNFKVLEWAMKHSKEVKDYKFLISLRKIAKEKMLRFEREELKEQANKLKIQIELIDNILNYVRQR